MPLHLQNQQGRSTLMSNSSHVSNTLLLCLWLWDSVLGGLWLAQAHPNNHPIIKLHVSLRATRYGNEISQVHRLWNYVGAKNLGGLLEFCQPQWTVKRWCG
jgi:hypothetical protein